MSTEVEPATRTSPELVGNVMSPAARTASEPPRRHGTWWKRSLFFIAVIGIIAAALPFVVKAVTLEKSGPKLTHKIARGDLEVSVTEQGTLESSNNTEIKCKVRGTATVLWVIEAGTIVKPGDELVRLDTSTIEDNISAQKIVYETARANKLISESDVAVAKTNITEYLESTYLEERDTIENEIFVAKQDLKTAQLSYESTKRLVARGLLSSLQLEGEAFAVESAQKTLDLAQKRLNALEKYTKQKNLIELEGALKAADARLAAETAQLELEKGRLDREEEQLTNCVIVAESSGMVILPSAAEWKQSPDIEEGATVRQDQILLMIPDLTQMQVKVGIHESKVDRIKPGLPARVELQDTTVNGHVKSVASVTRPAGWWTGNVVKYDTIIELDSYDELKPGMSAEVQVILATHKNVLTIPVAAVVEHGGEFFCWVTGPAEPQKRALQLGDSDDQFIVVEAGLKEGDEVVLNPLAFISAAQQEAIKPYGDKNEKQQAAAKDDETSKATKPATKETAKPKTANPKTAKPKTAASKKKPSLTGAMLVKAGDKNGDGVLTKDEFADKDRASFDSIDSNGDGKVDASELDVVLKAAAGAK